MFVSVHICAYLCMIICMTKSNHNSHLVICAILPRRAVTLDVSFLAEACSILRGLIHPQQHFSVVGVCELAEAALGAEIGE